MPPDEPSREEAEEQLQQDGATPFQPADPARDPDTPADSTGQPSGPPDTTHPITDTDVDLDEAYNAGLDAATGAEEPNAGNAVAGFQKPDEIQPS